MKLFRTPEGPDPERSHQRATLALLQSTHHGGAHPCLSNKGGWEGCSEGEVEGVKPWDPCKLSSSVSLPNHTSGQDEEETQAPFPGILPADCQTPCFRTHENG